MKKPIQLKLFGATLAIAAMAAALATVLLTADSGQAQQHATPEPCSDNPNNPAEVVDHGHYAVFEAYWDASDKNLVNNPCPPAVTHRIQRVGTRRIEVTDRTASAVDIRQTVLHVREGASETVAASSTTDYANYPFLYPDASDDNDDDRIEGAEAGSPLSTKIWELPSCEVDSGSDPDIDLCVGFSAGLLQAADWHGDVNYRFVTIRRPGINPADRGEAFAFENHGDEFPFWATSDTGTNVFSVTPGSYEHLLWVFTRPGTYVFAVQAEGRPTSALGLPSDYGAVTSAVQLYRFHVGLMADLNVVVTADDTAPSIGDTVTLTVTAKNFGPNQATDTKVQVNLPAGLTYATSSAAAGSYNPADGLWTVGDMATGTRDMPTTTTLTIRARVADSTRGQPQTVTANVFATEHIGSSKVVELDPHEGNNTNRATITPTANANVNPVFGIERSVAENSPAGTKVGPRIVVKDPDAGDPEPPALVGEGKENFDVRLNNGYAQIIVDENADIDYECHAHYPLTLQVSDGKDENGNPDMVVDDDTIMLDIFITDVQEHPTLTLRSEGTVESADHGTATVVATVTSPGDSCGEQLTYSYDFFSDGTVVAEGVSSNRHTYRVEYTLGATVTRTVKAEAYYTGSDGTEVRFASNELELTWW